MGGKPRKRGMVMWASRGEFYRSVVLWHREPERVPKGGFRARYTRDDDSLQFNWVLSPWPGPPIAPGECKRVRVIIEEDE